MSLPPSSRTREFLLHVSVLVAWAVTRGAVLLLPPVARGDVEIYQNYAVGILAGLSPWSDLLVEYPPGALTIFLLPALFGEGLGLYRAGFAALALAADFVITLLLVRPGSDRTRVGRLLAALTWLIASALLGPLLVRRFDIFPAALSLLAFCAIRRPAIAFGLLGAGAAVKLYPLLLVPALLAGDPDPGAGRIRGLARRALSFAVGAVLVSLPIFVLAGLPPPSSLLVQGKRGLQVESVAATPFVIARGLGEGPEIVFRTGAYDLTGPIPDRLAALLRPVLLVVLIGFAAALLFRARKCDPPAARPERGRTAAAATVGLILVLGNLLSPQFLLWLLPLGVLTLDRRGRPHRVVLPLLVLSAGLTAWLYPWHYYSHLVGTTTAAGATVLALRNALLVLLAVLLTCQTLLRRIPSTPQAQP